MSATRWLAPTLASLLVSGCGLRVPEIQDFGDSVDGQLFVEQIVANIDCEITQAVNYVVDEDKRLAPANGGQRQAQWFDSWGVQTTLTLTLDEKGSVNPTVNWTPPSPAAALFNLGGTGTLSSDANRVDKLNSFETVKHFLHRRCKRPDGPFLLQSDLKLREWLVDVILGTNTGVVNLPSDANGPFKSNVISHEIKFDVTSSGGLVPGWKLTRISVNQTGTGLTLSRERTHDLTITLGPVAEEVVQAPKKDKNGHAMVDRKGRPIFVFVNVIGPSPQAADAHLASQIGSSVAAGVKAALQP